MSSNTGHSKKLTLVSLILMIFTSVYGFNNIPRSFYLMGYGAIPWYILSAITFFIPFAFMMSEYGAAFRTEKGGIYSWMEKSVGPKYAFIATFMWYASNIIWMVNVGSTIWVPISNTIYGSDTTKSWSIFGFSAPKTLGLLAILWILFVTFTASRGLEKIKKITSVGGTAVALLNLVLIIGAAAVLIGNGGKFAQPLTGMSTFTESPNPRYSNPIAILSFLVFAIFAYGGIEVTGGLVDETENPEKTFPKGVTIAAFVIAVGYSVGIFLVGIFLNWREVMSSEGVNMGNVGYVTMANLGYQLGVAFEASEATSLTMGAWLARFVGISMFFALTGAFFTLAYSPLKQLIEGTPAKLWPGKMVEIKDGVPVNAIWIQGLIVIAIIFLVSFGGESVSKFFDILVAMTNVAMTLPYMFLSGAFYAFKKKKEIKKPFEVFRSKVSAFWATIIVSFTVGFANFFTIIEPAQNGDIKTTIYSIAGPIFFTLVAWVMYSIYEKRYGEEKQKKAA